MRLRRHKTAALVVLVVVGLVALAFREVRRAERVEAYRTAAGRYEEYARAYSSASSADGLPWVATSCYGGRWDQYTQRVGRDIGSHGRDKDYLRQKAAHYADLKERYERAAIQPDPSLSPDPPEPE